MAVASPVREPSSDAWRHTLASCFAGLETVAIEDVVVDGDLDDQLLGEVGLYRVAGTSQQVRRTTGAARRQPLDLLKVCLMTRGRAVVEQDDWQVAIGPGQFALYDTSRAYAITLQTDWECLVMTVPRARLGLPDGTLRRVMADAHGTVGAGQLLRGFLHQALGSSTASPAAAFRVGEAGVALLAGAVADHEVHANDLDHEELRHQVVAWISQHLHEPDLSTDRIARAIHLAPRTLQRLFEGEELGVAGLVRQLRLDAVRRDLDDPAMADRTITWIAARWGISDAPWLSRAFRSRYGVSPTGYREAR